MQRLSWFLRRLVRHPLALAGLIVLVLFALVACFAPWLAPHRLSEFSLAMRLKPPLGIPGADPRYSLGTDQLGRDILSRVIYGARVSILVGFVAVGISLLAGGLLGGVAGYFGGRLDQLLSRFADLLMAFPYLLFTIFAMGILGPGFGNLILALTFKSWVEFFRLMRAEVLAEKTKEYVEAARALGRGQGATLVLEILPNVMHSLVVLATLRMGYLIIMEASLSFLGLGVPPETPAWGSMVASGRSNLLDAWWVSTVPGLFIVVLVLSINLLGEGLRDILDPRLRLD